MVREPVVISGPKVYRVLVTGSRTFCDVGTLGHYIEYTALIARRDNKSAVFIHGDCPNGADHLTEKYCRTVGNYPTERHPADWEKLPNLAGHERNQKMVDLGADICLAFLDHCRKSTCRPHDHISHGTQDCMKRAEAAGIHVVHIWTRTPEGLF